MSLSIGNMLYYECLSLHLYFAEEGVTKTFTCARTLIGQHVFLQLVGVEGSLSLCEVEIFSTDGKLQKIYILLHFFFFFTKNIKLNSYVSNNVRE